MLGEIAGRRAVDHLVRGMRALGDPDVFLPGDVGIRHALERLGAPASDERWRPWRSYAVMHLWRSLAA